MAKNTFQFLDVGRFDPKKLDADVRIKQFGEIYGDFDADSSAEQARETIGKSREKHCKYSNDKVVQSV